MLGTVKNALVVWMGIIFLAELVTPLQVSHLLPQVDKETALSGRRRLPFMSAPWLSHSIEEKKP